MEETKIYQVDRKYKVQFERAASVKGSDGFKVEANGDDLVTTQKEANTLYDDAIRKVEANKPVQPIVKEKV